MYLLNTDPLTSLGCPLNAVFHVLRGLVPQDAETSLVVLLEIFNPCIISVAVLENVSPTQGYRKDLPFHTLILGPVGTGDRTRATWLPGSGASRSAIHYD
jgi:hypothetical protein